MALTKHEDNSFILEEVKKNMLTTYFEETRIYASNLETIRSLHSHIWLACEGELLDLAALRRSKSWPKQDLVA